jgi:hypothetical protein
MRNLNKFNNNNFLELNTLNAFNSQAITSHLINRQRNKLLKKQKVASVNILKENNTYMAYGNINMKPRKQIKKYKYNIQEINIVLNKITFQELIIYDKPLEFLNINYNTSEIFSHAGDNLEIAGGFGDSILDIQFGYYGYENNYELTLGSEIIYNHPLIYKEKLIDKILKNTFSIYDKRFIFNIKSINLINKNALYLILN